MEFYEILNRLIFHLSDAQLTAFIKSHSIFCGSMLALAWALVKRTPGETDDEIVGIFQRIFGNITNKKITPPKEEKDAEPKK